MVSLPSSLLFGEISFIGFGFLPCIILIILLVTQWNLEKQLRHSLAYAYLLRISGLLYIFTKHILYQPIMTVLLSPIWCSSISFYRGTSDMDYTCYSNTHLVILTFSCLINVMLTVLVFILIVLFSDEQPDSQLPWAYSSRMFDSYRLIWKLILGIFLQLCSLGSTVDIFAALVSAALGAFSLYEIGRQVYINQKIIFVVYLSSDTIIIMFSIVLLLEMLLGINLSNPIFLAPCALLVIAVIVFCIYWVQSKMISTMSINLSRDSFDVETYSRVLADKLVHNKETRSTIIEGIFAIHTSSCTNASCLCKSLMGKDASKEEEKKEDIPSSIPDKKIQNITKEKTINEDDQENSFDLNDVEKNNKNKNYLNFIIMQIENWNGAHDNKVGLHLYLGYLKLLCFPSPLASLYEVMLSQEEGMDIYQQFHTHRLL